MIKYKALPLILLWVCCLFMIKIKAEGTTVKPVKNGTAPISTGIISKAVMEEINNAKSYEEFEKAVKEVNLKAILSAKPIRDALKIYKIDASVFDDIPEDSLLQVIDLPKAWTALNQVKRPWTDQVVFGILMGNIDIMKLFTTGGFQAFLRNSMQTGKLQLPGYDDLSMDCAAEIAKLFVPLANMNLTSLDPTKLVELFQNPAIQMIDSWAKLPSGILQVYTYWYGSYSQCHKIEGARFCRVSTKIFGQIDGFYGTCMPKKCTNADVSVLIKLIKTTPLGSMLPEAIVSLKEAVYCDKEIEYSTGFYITVVICGIFMVLIMLGTFLDGLYGISSETSPPPPSLSIKNNHAETDFNGDIQQKKDYSSIDKEKKEETLQVENVKVEVFKPPMMIQVFVCFSLQKNLKTVLSTESPRGAIKCINGIRTISMFWVILGHCYSFLQLAARHNDNLYVSVPVLQKRFTMQALFNAFVSVDSFFLLSGLLVAYLTLKRMDKSDGKINFLMYYVHRFIRLTPPYMFVILFFNNIYYYILRGPDASPARDYKDYGFCAKYWWTNLLYINNFHPDKMGEECIGWSWYLANDMQFYIVAPAILTVMYILERRNKNSRLRHLGPFLVIAAGCTISIIIRMIMFGVKDYPALIAGNNPPEAIALIDERQDRLYIKPYTRMSPYLIGLFLGYAMSRKIGVDFVKRFKYLGWIIAILLGYAIVYGPYESSYSKDGNYFSKAENVFYGGFSSTVWAIAVSWVIYACHHGCGGFINDFLSWGFWIPLSRLTFGAYLLHPLVILYFEMGNETPFHYQDNLMVFHIIGITVLSYASALLLSVGVENPVMNLEKLLFKA